MRIFYRRGNGQAERLSHSLKDEEVAEPVLLWSESMNDSGDKYLKAWSRHRLTKGIAKPPPNARTVRFFPVTRFLNVQPL